MRIFRTNTMKTIQHIDNDASEHIHIKGKHLDEDQTHNNRHQSLMSLRSLRERGRPTGEQPPKVKQSRGRPIIYALGSIQLPKDLDLC